MSSLDKNSINSAAFAAHGSFRLWQPHSWRDHPILQQPEWSVSEVDSVLRPIRDLPPLISSFEIETLKSELSLASRGERFILQGGDCAERFRDCNEHHIQGRMRLLMQMAVILGIQIKKPVVMVGRMAGQYAKPRSELFELGRDGDEVPVFRGENINGFLCTSSERRADPKRLVESYHFASATLNYMRTLLTNGFGDVAHLCEFDDPEIATSWSGVRLRRQLSDLLKAKDFFVGQGVGALSGWTANLRPIYVSHEALILAYEEALTRFASSHGYWYNTGAHMLWIGNRTRDLYGAHVEYCRGVANPIGIKVSIDLAQDPEHLIALIVKMNPHNEAGKVSLITRLGHRDVAKSLPPLIQAIKKSGLAVTWLVDPMHGNTYKTKAGYKTRCFDTILEEVKTNFAIHRQWGSHLGGIHLEMTHQLVTECTGGSLGLSESQLSQNYDTWCDPRLNGIQSLDLAYALSGVV